MELLAIFTSAFVIGLSGAMMPGPLLTVTITEATRRGVLAGPLLIIGHVLLEASLVAALISGLSAFLIKPVVSAYIALVGGAFLAYMGLNMARDAYRGKIQLNTQNILKEEHFPKKSERELTAVGELVMGEPARYLHPVATGVLLSISNPYWILWWATIGLGYITLSLKLGAIGLAAFFTGHIMSDFFWYSLVAAAVVAGKRLISPRGYRILLTGCGIFLIFMGILFIHNGAHTLL